MRVRGGWSAANGALPRGDQIGPTQMWDSFLQRLCEIGQRRQGLLDRMRRAVEDGDKELVFELAKLLTGVADEASDRADTSLDRRAS